MSETRVVTPGELGGNIFGFAEGLIGSMDDTSFKGNTIELILEFSGSGQFQIAMVNPAVADFIGQQVLDGTLYFLKDINSFSIDTWAWQPPFAGTDLEDAFNASTTVTYTFDFRAETYTPPVLVTPYGNQGTLVGDTVNIDLNPNFTLDNTLVITNLPPGLSIVIAGIVQGTLTDNTGPFEVLVTATNSTGTTTATFTWNTYRLNTNTRIITSGGLGGVLFGFADGLLGSIDDQNLKGNLINGTIESVGQMTITMVSITVFDFIGQQILVGETTYFIKDTVSISPIQWVWPNALTGTDFEDAFNAGGQNVTVIYNINGVNTFLDSAINSDINTPIPFPAHFDNR